jgi:hypothetical protein
VGFGCLAKQRGLAVGRIAMRRQFRNLLRFFDFVFREDRITHKAPAHKGVSFLFSKRKGS